jgi:hypothetical protein
LFGTPELVSKDGKDVIKFSATNNAETGNVKKIVCDYQGTTITFKQIFPGETQVVYYEDSENLSELQQATLSSFTVYSGKAKMTRNLTEDTLSYDWAEGEEEEDDGDDEDKESGDTTPPVIKGFVGKKSYTDDDVYIVLYADRKTLYKKYIKAYDAQDGKVPVKADLSEVNWNKKGTYNITVTAKDSSGNVAKKKVKMQVRCLTGVDKYADSILKRITKSSWSDVAKCKAIYSYIGAHMRYVDYNGGASWESAALRALRYQSGNCYAYYGLARALLTRAGIPNIMITRYPAVPNHHHWWNLAYVRGGWYHFDTTPRRIRGRFCLLTDAQIRVYERRSPGTFRFAKGKYPKRATRRICSGPF